MAPVVRSGRIVELDALRGIAALAVVLFHYTARYETLFGHTGKLWSFSVGRFGVNLFFMISGFVIFMTIRRCRIWLDFVVSRVSRLYPAYWAAILLTFVVVSIYDLPGRSVDVIDMIVNFTMLQSFFDVPSVDSVYWTLKVEIIFYAFMFILYLVGCLDKVIYFCLPWLLLSIVAVSPYTSAFVPGAVQTLFILNYANLFVAGIIFFEVFDSGLSVWRGILLASCLCISWFWEGASGGGCVTAFFVIFWLFVQRRLAVLRWAPLVFVGDVSYPLYLIHQNVGYVVIRALEGVGLPSWICVLSAVATAFLAAAAITYLVDRPVREFLRRKYRQVAVTRKLAVQNVAE